MTTRTHFFRHGSLVALLVLALAAMGVVGMAGRVNAASRNASGLLQAPSVINAVTQDAVTQDNGATPGGPKSVSAQACCTCEEVKSGNAEPPNSPQKLVMRIQPHVFTNLLDLPPPAAPPRS